MTSSRQSNNAQILALTLTLLAGCVESPPAEEFENIDAVTLQGEEGATPTDSQEPAASQAEAATTAVEDGWEAMPAEDGSAPEPLSETKKSLLSKLMTDEDIVPSDPGAGFAANPGSPEFREEAAEPAATANTEPAPVARSVSSLIPGGLGNAEPDPAAAPAPFLGTDVATPTAAPLIPGPGATAPPAVQVAEVNAQPVLAPKAPEAYSEKVKPDAVDPVKVNPEQVTADNAKPEQGTTSPGSPAPVADAPAPSPIMFAPEKPRSLMVIAPRKLSPTSPPAIGEAPPAKAPAVVLPPSTAADPALMAKVETTPPQLDPQGPTVPPAPARGESEVTTAPTATPEAPAPAALPVPAPTETPAPVTPPEGFVSLLNGQDLQGWTAYDGKAESWKLIDGAATCLAPGGGWLQSDQLYTDFELRLEYRLSPGGNSGVSLRFPGTGNPSLDGLEIQLIDDGAEKYQSIQPFQASGSLYFAVAPKERGVTHPAGEWNQCVLTCQGSQVKVSINGHQVNEIDLEQLTKTVEGVARKVSTLRSPVGSIALQSHATPVAFRNIYLKDLTQALASGVRWLDLVPGNGDEVPQGAKVTVHYAGYLMTGKKFASSVDKNKPATVPLKDVIPGWREGIPGMRVGGKRRLIVPAELAYGAKGFKEIVPPNATLIYEIELLAIEKPVEAPPTQAAGVESRPMTR